MATASIPHRWKYDVFVSFRGEDIRKSFIDHLFKDFRQKGIHAFRDDNELPRGEEISPELYKAIEESRFLIVIFSKGYASSSWCLRELVKILECKQMGKHKHKVRIIFYDIKPDVVRKQKRSYAEAFTKYECSNRTEVAKWKEALSMAANISGWVLQDMANGYEAKFNDSISKEILEKLCDGPLHVGENLVGVDARVNKMNLLGFVESSKVHMIGICGISGTGKTTLAKAIYNLMYIHFEECSFCEDVQRTAKQHGVAHVLMQLIDDISKTRVVTVTNVSQGIMVMKQMIASKRILLVLDDVDHSDQLEALAGSQNWFFPGSLIIFTGKDKQLLWSHKLDKIYDMGFLGYDEALELFSIHAFGEKHPPEDFNELANQVVQYVQGLPLALKVLGCFLYDKPMPVWKSELDRLQVYPNAKIQQVLRLSFDGLDHDQQRIFLDIASSFIGINKDLAASVLDSCNLFADTNIRVLADKSLIMISSTMALQMHDLIQGMAREIIREESNKPGERSRLWIPSEVCDVLNKDKVTEAVQVLVLLLNKSNLNVHIDGKSFARVNNLRILKICVLESKNFEQTFEMKLPKDFEQTFEMKLLKDSKVNYSGSLRFLSNELRLLYWHGYPFKLLPLDFYPENIVAIDMSYSPIKNLWRAPMCFKKLKLMKLKHCRNLTNTPDFTEITNLEELILEGCVNLLEVHPSIGMLKRLVVLNMRNCIRLRSFPCTAEMYSLEVLILSGCLSQSNPHALSIGGHGGIQSRWRTSMCRPSSLLGKLQHPSSLALSSLAGLRLLRHLDLSHCNILELSSDSIGGLSCLQHLNLSGNNFTSLPASFSQLSQLEELGLVGCKKLEVLPELPPKIVYFGATDCPALRELHKQRVFYNNFGLSLDFTNCSKFVENYTIEILLFQIRNFLCKKLSIVLQGSRVPRWFTNQSTGNHVKLELPPGWFYNKFRGYRTCVVFRVKNPYYSSSSWLTCQARDFDGNVLYQNSLYLGTVFPDDTIRVAGSDLIWFYYSKLYPGWKGVDNFVTFTFTSTPDIEVKQCGAKLDRDEDIQEMVSSMIQGLPPSIQDGVVFRFSSMNSVEKNRYV